MKDPAFLFYPNDFIGGTMGMTLEQKGAYIELLVLQFNRSHMELHMMRHMIGENFDEIWPALKDKFKIDENGKYYNERLETEINKRKAYADSRRKNLQSVKKSKKQRSHMERHMDVHMDVHMENENENTIINKNAFKKLTEIYFNFYFEKVGTKPDFGKSQGNNMKQLINKIAKTLQNNQSEVTEEKIAEFFISMLKNLPDFYLKNLNINIINSSYATIIANIRQSKPNGQEQIERVLTKIRNEREPIQSY